MTVQTQLVSRILILREFGVSAIDTKYSILSGRSYGGVGNLWRKSISKYITVVQYDDKRMIGCKLCINNNTYLFVNVYLPFFMIMYTTPEN